MKKKIKVICIVLLCLGAALVGFVVYKETVKKTVSTELIERTDVEITVNVKGTVKGRDTVKIYSPYGKKIHSVKVAVGDKVEKGTILCDFENTSDQISTEQAELAVEDARREYENAKELYDLGTVMENDLKTAESALKQAELNLKNAKEQSNTLESPISGTVTRVNTAEGKTPLSSEVLFVIEDLEELQMDLKVSEDDISRVQIGQSVRISTPVQEAYSYGKVTEIALTGEEKNSTSADRVVPVKVVIEKNDSEIIAGITGRAEIIVASCQKTLTVPVEGLSIEKDGIYIYLVRNGKIEKKAVSILLENGYYAAIDDGAGVSEGDEVVIQPDPSLSEGTEVSQK